MGWGDAGRDDRGPADHGERSRPGRARATREGWDAVPEPERWRRQLWTGFLILPRWGMIVWMVVIVATAERIRGWPLVVAVVGAIILWNAWVTTSPARRERTPALWADLGLTATLVVVSQAMAQPGPDALDAAALYKWTTPGVWGLSRGPAAGVLAGAALSVVHVASGSINGMPLTDLTAGQVQQIAYTTAVFLMIGATLGGVSRMLHGSSMQLQAAMDEALREREHAGRLLERERLARQIHDSVLQALLLVRKQGREVAGHQPILASEVLDLAEMAGAQEEALRSMILREQDAEPNGNVPLHAALEALGRAFPQVPVTVSSVGPVWLPAAVAEEVLAAVRQAVDNVGQHAAATRTVVFTEEEDGMVIVSVRDDGKGFVYDEEALRRRGRCGILKSIKGRIEALDGTVSIRTAPARGTEIELRVPVVRP